MLEHQAALGVSVRSIAKPVQVSFVVIGQLSYLHFVIGTVASSVVAPYLLEIFRGTG